MQSLAVNGYTAKQVDSALHSSNRQLSFKYNLLDHTNNFKKTLTNVTAGSVANDTTSAIKRTAKFTLSDDGSINFLSDRIQPFVNVMVSGTTNFNTDAHPPTFTRPSIAYNSDGTQSPINVPRYQQGKFGQALLVEEGTSNLVVTNAGADPQFLSSTNWSLSNATISSGSLTLKSPDGITVAMCATGLNNILANTPHSFSIYVKYLDTTGSPGTVYLDFCGIGYDNATQELDIFPTQLGTSYQLFTKNGFDSGVPPMSFQLRIFTFSTRPVVIEWVQVEQKPYSTSFISGTRQPEVLSLPYVSFNQSFSVETWVKIPPCPQVNGDQPILFQSDTQSPDKTLHLVVRNGKAFFGFFGDDCSGVKTLTDNNWHSVAFVFDVTTKTQSIYIDGALDNSRIATSNYLGATGNTYVGTAWSGGAYLDGLIDDLRISSIARSASDILAAYNSNSPSSIDQFTTYKLNFDGNINAKQYLYIPAGVASFPLGVFLLSSPTKKTDLTGKVFREIDAYDQTQILSDTKVETRYTVTMGTNYIAAVKALLDSAGITFQNLTPTTSTLPATQDWDPGTSYLDIVNALLGAITYNLIWFNEIGQVIASPYILPTLRSCDYTYSDNDLSVIFPDIEQTMDLFGVPNKWVMVVSEADQTPISSTYTNANPNSLTSTVSRGRTITSFQTVTAADQPSLDTKVQAQAVLDSQIYDSVVMNTAMMPMHSDNDMLQLNYSFLGISNPYEEIKWSMDLAIGTQMKHTIRRVVSL